MFDKYVMDGGRTSSYYNKTNIEIDEHKAPTDESVRLLREMEKSARDSIVDSIQINNNLFSGAIVLFNHEHRLGSYRLAAKFKINGEEFFIEEFMKDYEIQRNNIENILKTFCDGVAYQISRQLMLKLMDDDEDYSLKFLIGEKLNEKRM